MTTFLTTIEVASKLKLHPVTVRQMAKDRTIPGGKLGDDGEWRFLEDDLVAYIRGQYVKPAAPCLSTSSQGLRTGTRTSPSPVAHAYVDRLAQRIESRRRKSTTSGSTSYGK